MFAGFTRELVTLAIKISKAMTYVNAEVTCK